MTTVASEATAHIIAGMRAHGVRRLVVQSSIGVGTSRGKGGFIFERIAKPFLLAKEFEDKERQEALVRASDLDWVIVQPTRLTDAPARRKYRVSTDGSSVPSTISRADVADFIVGQLVATTHLRTAAVIGG